MANAVEPQELVMPRFDNAPLAPPPRGVSPITIGAVIGLAFVAWLWFESASRPTKQPPAPPPPTPAVAPAPIAAPLRPPPTTALPAPQAPQAAPPAAPPAWVSIYLCKSWQGAQFWASTPCGEHRASIDRIHRVSGSLPWDQQVAVAQAEAQAAARLYVPPATTVIQSGPAREAAQPARSAECAMLDRSIEYYDAITRQPQPARVHDEIRIKRREAMDRKFELRC